MRERKYVKFKLDIYDDTKTKIIDQKPERDFIHYFFARSIILAGKSDCEGQLYLGKDIPYTIETLAIEFGREVTLIETALDVLIELKMIEVTEDNVYKVKSFAKHQNIKIKEKDKASCNDGKNIEEAITDEIAQKENVNKGKGQSEVKSQENDLKKVSESNGEKNNLEVSDNGGNEIRQEMKNNNLSKNFEVISSPLLLQEKKTNKNNRNRSKKKETEISVTDEQEKDDPLFTFCDGDFVLREGENIIWELNKNNL